MTIPSGVYCASTQIQVSGADISGTIFLPNAQMQIAGGSGTSYNMFSEAKQVSISGCCWTMNGSGPLAGATQTTQLIE
jgi:hypothetical protein